MVLAPGTLDWLDTRGLSVPRRFSFRTGCLGDAMKYQPSLEAVRSVSGALESYVATLGLCLAQLIVMSLLLVARAGSVPKVRPEPSRRGGKLEQAPTA